MTFKGMEIRDALLDELRTDESPGIVPELAVGGKDRIAEEVKPSGMEELALAFKTVNIEYSVMLRSDIP